MSGLEAALHPVCLVAFVAVAALLAFVAARALVTAGDAERRAWLGLALGAFGLALALRLAVEPLPSNWYNDVLPAHGEPSWERFGPGAFLFQAALRVTLPWSDTTLFAANAVVGALAMLPYAALLHELELDRFEAGVALFFLVISPLHVRVSASASEHALTSTLTVLALWAWVRGVAQRDLVACALACACVPAASLTRPDAWPALAMVPLWPILATSAPGRRALVGGAAFAVVWIATGVLVIGGAQHPAPSVAAMAGTLVALVPQFFVLALVPPFWFSPVALALAVLGAAVAFRNRRPLLACVAISIAMIFVPLGRQVGTNGLVGARYFLAAFAVLGVLVGVGAGRARAWLEERKLPALGVGIALAVVATAFSIPALRARYAFQDEYAFLRVALGELPDGCTVASIPVSGADFEQDVDTALDPPRSPLTLAYPRLTFLRIDDAWTGPRDRCVAVYESALCAIRDTPEVLRRFPRARELTRARCERARFASGRVLGEREVSPRALYDVFGDGRPAVRLVLAPPPSKRVDEK